MESHLEHLLGKGGSYFLLVSFLPPLPYQLDFVAAEASDESNQVRSTPSGCDRQRHAVDHHLPSRLRWRQAHRRGGAQKSHPTKVGAADSQFTLKED